MRPAARLAAAAGILDVILDGARAEAALSGWSRSSRYAGSKDRAAVRDLVFAALRCKRSYACLGGAMTGRGLMIGYLRASGIDLGEMLTGDPYALDVLAPGEGKGVLEAEPDAVRYDMPDWLIQPFEADLGERAVQVMQALQRRAPVFLRVNGARASRTEALSLLSQDGIKAVVHPTVQSAVIVEENARRVRQSAAYADGIVELQDAASQDAVLDLPLQDGDRVLDYCAGGGGKTLAMAARARVKIWAYDAAPARMADLPVRATRAGVVVTQVATEALPQAAPFDLVLVDAPCSGSGTWRRDPEGKWALTPARLQELQALQAEILGQAAALVRPGGHLAYMTCSVLRSENENQIDRFATPASGWIKETSKRWQPSGQGDGFFLCLLKQSGAHN